MSKIVVVLSVLALAKAQIPNLGWCPEYVPMTNFDMSKFLGNWYEAERYFQFLEVGSGCVRANYTIGPDGKYRVTNEVTNAVTGFKRVWDGEIKPPATKADEGKLHIKYTGLPLTPEYKYSVLETDYTSYAVLWNCNGVGLLSAQSAWIMTRQPFAPGEIMQKAYAVLDKYKISKAFFLKTRQDDCVYSVNPPLNLVQQQQVVQEEKESQKKESLHANVPPNLKKDSEAEMATPQNEQVSSNINEAV